MEFKKDYRIFFICKFCATSLVLIQLKLTDIIYFSGRAGSWIFVSTGNWEEHPWNSWKIGNPDKTHYLLEIGSRWWSRRTCTQLLWWEHQNCNLLLQPFTGRCWTHQRKVKIPPSCDKEEVTIKAKSHTHQVDNPQNWRINNTKEVLHYCEGSESTSAFPG